MFVLTVLSDSYMGIFLPADVSKRISKFLEGNLDFPIIDKDEIMGVFFLFGKNFGVKTNLDISYVKDLARRSIDQVKREG